MIYEFLVDNCFLSTFQEYCSSIFLASIISDEKSIVDIILATLMVICQFPLATLKIFFIFFSFFFWFSAILPWCQMHHSYLIILKYNKQSYCKICACNPISRFPMVLFVLFAISVFRSCHLTSSLPCYFLLCEKHSKIIFYF